MKILRKRILAVLLSVVMTATMLVALPAVAHAGTGLVIINIDPTTGTFSSAVGAGTTIDNSATPAESQWEYDDANKILYLLTPGGAYTLTGANTNLSVFVGAYAPIAGNEDISVTLSDVTITRAVTGGPTFRIWNPGTVTLVGTNTLDGNASVAFMVSATSSCTINGSGSLNISTPSNSAIGLDELSTLKIEGSVIVNASSSAGVGISFWRESTINVGVGATLGVTGGYAGITCGHGTNDEKNTILSDGTIIISSTNGYGISVPEVILVLGGSGTIDVHGAPTASAIFLYPFAPDYILMGDNITLHITNNAASAETHTFQKSNPTSAYRWLLSGGASFVPPSVVTDDLVNVSFAAGGSGTISLKPIPPTLPTITSANSFSCVTGTGGSFPLTSTGTAPVTFSLMSGTVPAGVSISGSTLVVAGSVPKGVYNFVKLASNAAPLSVSQDFTLNVTAADTGGSTGGNTSGTPATGDSTALMLLLGALLAVAIGAGAIFAYKRRDLEK